MASWIVRGGSHLGDAEQDFLESRSVGIYFGADKNIDGMSDAVLRRRYSSSILGGWRSGMHGLSSDEFSKWSLST